MVAATTLHGVLVNNLRDDGCPLCSGKGTTVREMAAHAPKTIEINTFIFNGLQNKMSLDYAFFCGFDTT